MFWGLIMEPERRYTQQVKKSFHISMASLDAGSSNTELSQVMCGYEGRNYLLCTLKQPDLLQCPLDLEFAAGTEVSFASNGKAHIHLTGYLTDVDEDSLNLNFLAEEDEDVEAEQEEKPVEKKKLHKMEKNNPPAKKAKLINGSAKHYDDKREDDGEESDDADSPEEIDTEEEDNESDEYNDSNNEEEIQMEHAEEEHVQKKLNEKHNKKVKKTQMVSKQVSEMNQKKQKQFLKGGVVVEDITEGSGNPAKVGKFVNVYYEGRLEKNNKMFDSTTKGPGFKFRLGAGEVIKAWDIGLVGMKVGGVRKIICPPNLAYGAKGSPPAIPPNSTLVFTVTLKKLN